MVLASQPVGHFRLQIDVLLGLSGLQNWQAGEVSRIVSAVLFNALHGPSPGTCRWSNA